MHPFTRIAGSIFVALLAWWMLRLQPADAALRRSPAEQMRVAIQESRALMREGKLKEALRMTEVIDKQNKANTVTLVQLATIHDRLGQFRQEAEAWERFASIAPRPEEACPDLPRAYDRAGLEEKALDAYRRCVGFDSNNPDLLLFYGIALERRSRLAESKEQILKALASSPEYPDLHTALGRLALRAGDNATARRESEGVLAKRPGDSDALLVAGLAALRLGDRAAARERLQKGAGIVTLDPDFQVALGTLSMAEGKNEEAIAHYRKALSIDPNNRDAASGLARFSGHS